MSGSRGRGDGPGPVDGDTAAKGGARGRAGRDSEFVLREPAVSATVRVARSAIRNFADQHGASEAVQTAVGLAVTEACANVVVHAYVDAETVGHLELRAHIRGDELIVQVSDEGRGMQPRVDSPGLGMGLPLIAQMADTFEILDHQDRPGVAVRMHFQLTG